MHAELIEGIFYDMASSSVVHPDAVHGYYFKSEKQIEAKNGTCGSERKAFFCIRERSWWIWMYEEG